MLILGVIVEQATAEALFTSPLHPYTKALISAALPSRPGAYQERIILSGEVLFPNAPAVGLSLPHPLPVCPGALRHRRAAAAGIRPGPYRRVPLVLSAWVQR